MSATMDGFARWLPWSWLFGPTEATEPSALDVASELPPSIFARTGDRERAIAMGERLVGLIAGRVLTAREHDDVLHEIDAVLQSGDLPRYIRPMMASVKLAEVVDHRDEFAEQAKVLAERLSPRARDAIGEGMGTLVGLMPLLGGLHDDQAPGEIDAAVRDAAREPMSYLTQVPVPVARLMLAAERGLVAYFALEPVLSARWLDVPEASVEFIAALFRDGMHAMAILLASVQPELVPTSIVPVAARLDRDALLAAQALEDAQYAKWIADADGAGSTVHAPADDA